MHRANQKPSVVVELAGLPGAGKTTICRHLTTPHRTKASVPLIELRPSIGMFAVAWDLLMLCLGARPFQWARLLHAINFVALMRCYTTVSLPVVLEQGMLHKIWSMLMDAESYSATRLQSLIASIRPFAPNYLVWVDAPVHTAGLRVSQRSGGRSRFDNLTPRETEIRLAQKSLLLNELFDLYRQHTECIRIDGQAPAEDNAGKIERLLAVEYDKSRYQP
jgi:adenylate kinase family enzyme